MNFVKRTLMRVPNITSKHDGSLTWWGFLLLYAAVMVAAASAYWVGSSVTG